MATQMLQKRGTAAEWAAANPILASGEMGFETDTKLVKLGDGVTPWNSLDTPYLPTGGGTLTGDLTLPNDATAPGHAVRKSQLDDYLPLVGGTLLGHVNVLDAIADDNPAKKKDVDDLAATVGVEFGDYRTNVDMGLLSTFQVALTATFTPPGGWATYTLKADGFFSMSGTTSGDVAQAHVNVGGVNGTIHSDDADTTPRFLMAYHTRSGLSGATDIELTCRNSTASRGTFKSGAISVIAFRTS